MRFVHTAVRVRDIDASLRFYEALGFERRGKLQFQGAYNVYLGVPGDGDTLELTVNEGRDEPYDLGTGYGHIALTVGDLDAVVAKLAEQGIEPEKPPYHREAATRSARSASWPTRTATASSSSAATSSARRRTDAPGVKNATSRG
jgi:lactoylglutathione lyase